MEKGGQLREYDAQREKIADYVNSLVTKRGPVEAFEIVRKAARNYVYGLRSKGEISFSEPNEGDIPSVHVIGNTIPEVWERTTIALMGIGQSIHTGYDPQDESGKYTSFPSMEATVMMHINKPFGEPRFHMNYLGGWMSFGDYQAEIEGVKDGWMISPAEVIRAIKEKRFDEIKGNKKWKYTYHQRLYTYPALDIEAEPTTINQIQSLVKKLVKEPLSKSAQAVTWDPRWDHNDRQMGVKWDDYDSPCLQRFWFRLMPSEGKEGYTLNVNSDWRSRDHYKAVPQNIFGVTEGIFEKVRTELEQKLETPVRMGRYLDKSDSLHLYGHYFDVRKSPIDAKAALGGIFKVTGIPRISKPLPIEERLILPGTSLHNMMTEEIAAEYKKRVENPNFGLSD